MELFETAYGKRAAFTDDFGDKIFFDIFKSGAVDVYSIEKHETTIVSLSNEQVLKLVEILIPSKIKELEAENARLRQQRDAANAQLDCILENMKEEKAP